MKYYMRSLLLLLLAAASIAAAVPDSALARNPIPAKERVVVNPSYADPGEDPHLSILVEPAPSCTEKSGCAPGAGNNEAEKEEAVCGRSRLFDKLGFFIYSFYLNMDNILF
jgi:hypothetical protein